ncbi:AAA family ATPase [Virgibacillus necropolis]|uniref:AAA family ATPase n=1 Tax=Virgibacillus necropolis TaxID=163877 RepID=UPI00384CDFCF
MKPEKIHIIGSVGSGKTTFSRRLSKRLTIAYYELDNVVWKRRENVDVHDVKRSPQERDEYFSGILNSNEWIVEGVHSGDWVMQSIQKADVIVLLDTSYFVRIHRIIRRFFLQKLGREKANYVPSFKIFWRMFKWNHLFEKDKSEILKKIYAYNENLVILSNHKDLEKYLEEGHVHGLHNGLKETNRL